MAMIYRAIWKSHECPTRDLSIPEVLSYLSDENMHNGAKLECRPRDLLNASEGNFFFFRCRKV